MAFDVLLPGTETVKVGNVVVDFAVGTVLGRLLGDTLLTGVGVTVGKVDNNLLGHSDDSLKLFDGKFVSERVGKVVGLRLEGDELTEGLIDGLELGLVEEIMFGTNDTLTAVGADVGETDGHNLGPILGTVVNTLLVGHIVGLTQRTVVGTAEGRKLGAVDVGATDGK